MLQTIGMTLEREMKDTYNMWIAEKFLEQLTKNTSASKRLVNSEVLKPLAGFAEEQQTPGAPVSKVAPSAQAPPEEKAGRLHLKEIEEVPGKVSAAKGDSVPLEVLDEDFQWTGGDGYFSDGSDYGDYVEQHVNKHTCPKKRRLHRIGSAMDAVEPRLSETLLSSPPTSNVQLSLDTSTAPPGFSFMGVQNPGAVWEGGDAFFSEGSEMSPTHSCDALGENFGNMCLDEKPGHPLKSSAPDCVTLDVSPMPQEWEGGDGYFSGSDY